MTLYNINQYSRTLPL